MRESAVYDALVVAIEGATIDADVGGESFTHVDMGGAAGGLTERSFVLRRVSLSESLNNNTRMPRASYELEIFYSQHPDVGERMLADAERLGGALWGLHTSQADVCRVEVGEWQPGVSVDVESMNSTVTEIVVRYSLDNGV